MDSIAFGPPAVVTVQAAYTKNDQIAEIPIRDDLPIALNIYMQSIHPGTLSIAGGPIELWPGSWPDSGAEMIRGDLASATLPYTESQGRDYDFHALRHQFITELSKAGVSLRVAQELARHSKPELTANVYTHLTIRDTASDVEKLPPIPTSNQQESMVTGTDGQILGQCDLSADG